MQPEYKQFNQNKPKRNSDVADAGSTVSNPALASATVPVPKAAPQRLFALRSRQRNLSVADVVGVRHIFAAADQQKNI